MHRNMRSENPVGFLDKNLLIEMLLLLEFRKYSYSNTFQSIRPRPAFQKKYYVKQPHDIFSSKSNTSILQTGITH